MEKHDGCPSGTEEKHMAHHLKRAGFLFKLWWLSSKHLTVCIVHVFANKPPNKNVEDNSEKQQSELNHSCLLHPIQSCCFFVVVSPKLHYLGMRYGLG